MTKETQSRRLQSADEIADLAPESLEPSLNRPVSAQAMADRPVRPLSMRRQKKSGSKILITLLVIIILAAAALFYLDASGKVNLFGSKQEIARVNFNSSDWQAIFLSNGQVYFGHLKNAESTYPQLTDIYYLQVQNVPIQPAEPATEEAGVQPAQTQQRLILVKFGTELHKPKDRMYLNKDHIVFYEDLAEDSAVVTSIQDYLASQAGQAAGE